jgi:replicative superfamily II helicase
MESKSDGTSVPAFIELQPVGHKKHKVRAKQLRRMEKIDRDSIPDYATDPSMSEVGIPPFLQDSYLNGCPPPRITELRPWQKNLFIQSEWRSGQNAVILVPTSGGKTLAAEVAIAQLLDKDPNSKSIYALPFVSLASEKTTDLRRRFHEHLVRPFYQNVGGSDFRRGSIAVCTYEKVHSLLNLAIKEKYVNTVKLVVIDEVHMIGEEHRGSVVEAIIVKLKLLRSLYDIRIIGLTATLNASDATTLSKWICGFTYLCNARPTRISHYFKSANGDLFLFTEKGEQRKVTTLTSVAEDVKHILHPIRTALAKEPSSICLIFVNTRKMTATVASFIAAHICDTSPALPAAQMPNARLIASRNLLIERLAKTDAGLDSILGKCVANGVAFHHAGMLLEERKLIEDAARDSTISVIVATTTLSAGINIKSVSRVIIHDIYRRGRQPIPTSVYVQMAGRAGRDEKGGGCVIVLASVDDEAERKDALELAKQNLDSLNPQLLRNNAADRYFLQCLACGLVSPDDGLSNFVNACFEVHLGISGIEEKMTEIADRLRFHGLIEAEGVAPTPLGRSIASASLSIEEGLEVKAAIDNLQQNLRLKDDVHLLYLCVPPSTVSGEATPSYDCEIWENLVSEHKEVVQLISGLDAALFERHIVMTLRNGGKKMNRDEMAQRDR